MKRTSRLFAFLLASMMLFSLLPLSAFAVSTALQGKNIIAFGDSLTALGGSKTYVNYLSSDTYLGVSVTNAGVGGDSTKHGLARFEADVLSKDPDVVIICFGMNDQACLLASGTPNIPLETYRSNLTYFAEKLGEIDCDVVFVTPHPVVKEDGYYVAGAYGLDYGYGFLDDFCNVMREVAVATGGTIVDINDECDYEDLYKFVSTDGIHQTDYGRQQYAKYVSEHMIAVYDGTNKATMTVNCVDENGNTLKSYTLSGKAGAHITVPTPYIEGYTTEDADVTTVYTDGATFTFTYSFELQDLVDEAMKLTYNNYGTKVIGLLREAIAEANVLIADKNASAEEILASNAKIKELLAINGTANYVLSKGASYTTTAPNRTDSYNDDGVRLTDGVRGYPDGSKEYSGWNNTDIFVTVDLGKVTKADYFSVYCASGMWGIKRPSNLTVSVSTDGTNFTKLGTQTALKNTIETKSGWDTSIISVVTEEPIDVRYVKFEMAPNGPHTWIDEVEVSLSPEKVYNGIYVTGINEKVDTNSCNIFTSDFGTVTAANANHKYTANAVAEWNTEKNAFVVKSVTLGAGDSTADITLAENEILISAHTDHEDYVSVANYKKVRNLTVGQELTLDGIDLDNNSRQFASYIAISNFPEEEVIDGDVFWVTHFGDNTVEGAGTIFTKEYTGCGWWAHVAFAPVAGLDNVYEVVAKDITGNGGAKPLTIPEGGFAWVTNTGNNYVEIESDETRLNYKNDGANAAVALATAMQIGDRYVFSGLNLDTHEVPTTTPHIDYFAPEYVCTARYAPYEPEVLPSTNKNYTTTAPNRGDGWDDDGIRLTDGIKATADGGAATADGTYVYSGWSSADKTQPNAIDVIVDLGEIIDTDTYTVYLAGGNWGIMLPNEVISIEVLVSDTADGEYTLVANAPVGSAKLINGSGIDGQSQWSTYSITATAEAPVSARFIKIIVTHTATGNGTIWMDEVEAVLLGSTSPDPDPTYILGDVDNSGTVDSVDYLLVKRSCFNTYTLSVEEKTRANVNGDDKIDSVDYVLVKRIAFGTYTAQ